MNFNTAVHTEVLDPKRYHEIVLKVSEDVFTLFKDMKATFGTIPSLMAEFIVVGYLRGKGYTWEECFVGMAQFKLTMEKFNASKDMPEGRMTILGQGDGTIKSEVTDMRGTP